MRTRIAVAVFAFALGWAPPSSAAPFNQFIAFGDSSIDSGWWSGALNNQCGQVLSPCTTGSSIKDGKIAAAINNGGTGAPVGVGLMSTQVLAADYGLTAIPANQAGGTNYAISGALSAPVGGSGNLNPNPNLPSTVQQITNYLSANGNVANPNALYEIGSGGNDRTYALNTFSTGSQRQAFLSAQAQTLATQIQALQAAGAQTILVRTAQATIGLSGYWTNMLFGDLDALNVDYIRVNMAGLVQTVENNPTAYGFTSATVFPGVAGIDAGSACLAGAGASGWGQWCANTTTPNSEYSHLRATDSEQTSFWSDDQHFSAAGQAIVAQYEYELIQNHVATTPLPATLPMFASGLGGLALLRRRSRRKWSLS